VVSAVVAAFCGLVLCGCKPNKRYDLIESELRTKDKQLAETQAALEATHLAVSGHRLEPERGRPRRRS